MSPPVRTIGSLASEDPTRTETMDWLAQLLCTEGTNLMEASEGELARGTPVYVEAHIDALEVQRRMARFHIRRLAVVGEGTLVGIVDLVDLARSESGVLGDPEGGAD
jgi:signal-transduction protein with cAMP-binding, CBS, and nucleotidyltransferase domain